MRQQRGNRKNLVQPVTVTTAKLPTKVSERTIRKRQEAKNNKFKRSRFANGLNTCGIIFLYILLILCILIGGGGIAVCVIYFNANSATQTWKIGGIVIGGITCAIGCILIFISIFKQTRKRPWQYKKKEYLFDENEFIDQMGIEDYDVIDEKDESTTTRAAATTTIVRSQQERRQNEVALPPPSKSFDDDELQDVTREIATSPIPDSSEKPLQQKSDDSDLIFCPGCNRLHPSAHQCMYSTRIANGFSIPFRPTASNTSTTQDSVGIQTEDKPVLESKKKKKSQPHTTIDRSSKLATSSETQTVVTAKPSSTITESIILRRVPIPTTKVVVQQPTTKVMIVKVPNVAGQLILQSKSGAMTEQQQSDV